MRNQFIINYLLQEIEDFTRVGGEYYYKNINIKLLPHIEDLVIPIFKKLYPTNPFGIDGEDVCEIICEIFGTHSHHGPITNHIIFEFVGG